MSWKQILSGNIREVFFVTISDLSIKILVIVALCPKDSKDNLFDLTVFKVKVNNLEGGAG